MFAPEFTPSAAEQAQWRRDYLQLQRLLDDIDDNATEAFQPSPSLANIPLASSLSPPSSPPPSQGIDLVVSGGGLKGYTVMGASLILRRQLQKRGLHIARVAGASCGAWCAFFIMAGVSTEDWLKSYQLSRMAALRKPSMTILEIYRDVLWPWLEQALDPDAYLRCSGGRCCISITRFAPVTGRPMNWLVSDFTSNRDLFDACMASSTIPMVTTPGLWAPKYRGVRVIDGGLTLNTPIFEDGQRRQIVVRLSRWSYPFRLLVTPVDRCIEAFVVRGALQMSRFLEGRAMQEATAAAAAVTRRTGTISSGLGGGIVWVEQHSREEMAQVIASVRTKKRVRLAALIVAIGLALYRAARLPAWLANLFISRISPGSGGGAAASAAAAMAASRGGGGSAGAVKGFVESLGGSLSFTLGVFWTIVVRIFRAGGMLL